MSVDDRRLARVCKSSDQMKVPPPPTQEALSSTKT